MSEKKSAAKKLKVTTHYTEGYGGNYNYPTTCGKDIHTHSDTDKHTIDPAKVDCKKCKATKEWKQDYKDYTTMVNPNIKRRIYLQSDFLHITELHSAQCEVEGLCVERKEKFVRRIFSDVLELAWHDLGKTWTAVKNADEIYADSSLMPLSGGSYSGAPVIFNGMCERAIKEKVRGKNVYILHKLNDIHWGMIEIQVMKKAFKHNNLYMYDDAGSNLVLVDVSKVKNKKP